MKKLMILCCMFILSACSVGGSFGMGNGGAGVGIATGISF